MLYRECLGLLKTADGDKIVEDPIIESFYKVHIKNYVKSSM